MVSRRNRGQLILIAGVVIALLVFGIVMLLNSMLFVNNAAPHQASKNMEDGSAYRVVVEDDLQRIVDETAGGERYVRADELQAKISTYDRRMGEVAAENAPSYLNVGINKEKSDSIPLLIQNTSGHFESKSSDKHNWRMFEEGSVEEFEMVTSGDSSYTASGKFKIILEDDDGDMWSLSIYKESGDLTVETMKDNTQHQYCPGFDKSEKLKIDLNTVSGEGRPACSISFADGLDGSYSFDIESGNQIKTTYRILVNGAVDERHTDGAGAPYRVDAITSAAFDLQYDTPDISYETTITDIRPNDATPPSTPPTASFTISNLQPAVEEEVTLDAGVSADTDGVIDKYEWDTDGDGEIDKTGPQVDITFNQPGVQEVELTIEDNDGKRSTVTRSVYPYLAINVLGGELDYEGHHYVEDSPYATGGNPSTTGDKIDGASADSNPFQSMRFGDQSHDIPVSNGRYVVTLQFSEIYWENNGQRRFDVSVEGNRELKNLDVHKRSGHDGTFTKQVTVEVTDGELNIKYISQKDNAIINGVIIKSEEQP